MPTIKGESNKLTGLATAAQGRRVQDITVQGSYYFAVAFHEV